MTVKSFLTVGKFSYYGRVLGLWKISRTVESLQRQIHKGKLTFLTAEKIIGLIILKASVKTIKAYILSLEQKESRICHFCGRQNQYYIQ